MRVKTGTKVQQGKLDVKAAVQRPAAAKPGAQRSLWESWRGASSITVTLLVALNYLKVLPTQTRYTVSVAVTVFAIVGLVVSEKLDQSGSRRQLETRTSYT